MQNDRRYVPPAEAARYLGYADEDLKKGEGWLAKRRHFGLPPAYSKLGGRVLYDIGDLDELMIINKRASTSETPSAA